MEEGSSQAGKETQNFIWRCAAWELLVVELKNKTKQNPAVFFPSAVLCFVDSQVLFILNFSGNFTAALDARYWNTTEYKAEAPNKSGAC